MMSCVRGETSYDLEEESLSVSSVFYDSRSMCIEGRSRRNKRQKICIGRKTRDSLPVQICVVAAHDNRLQEKSKSCHELDLAKDNRFEKNRKKKKKTKTEFIAVKVDVREKCWEKENQVIETKEEMVEKTEEFQVRGPPRRGVLPVQVRGPPHRGALPVQVRGPPPIQYNHDTEKREVYDSEDMRYDKNNGNEEWKDGKDHDITEDDRKSMEKKRKEEMNILMSERVALPLRSLKQQQRVALPPRSLKQQENVELKSRSLKQQERVALPARSLKQQERVALPPRSLKQQERVALPTRSLKQQEKDQMSKFQMLMGNCRDRSESSKESKSEKESEKYICDQKKVNDGNRVEDDGSERRVKQVAKNGVTYYCDNRLLEQKEKEETSSKERLESIYLQVHEKDDSLTEKVSTVSNGRQDGEISSTEGSYNVPTEHSWCESYGTLTESTLSLNSGCGLDLPTLMPVETRALVTNEDRKLFGIYLKALKDQINNRLAIPKDQMMMKSLDSNELVDSGSNKSEIDEDGLEDKKEKDIAEKENVEPECGDTSEDIDDSDTEECIDSEEKDDMEGEGDCCSWKVEGGVCCSPKVDGGNCCSLKLDRGDCRSVKVYSWARSQELEEMTTAFEKLGEKVSDLNMNMQTKLIELCGVLKSLDRQSLKTQKCQTCTCVAGQQFVRWRKGPLVCAKRPRKKEPFQGRGDGLYGCDNHRCRKRQWEMNNHNGGWQFSSGGRQCSSGGRQYSSAGATDSGGSSQSGGISQANQNGGGPGGSSNGNYGNGLGNHGNGDTGGGGDGNDRYPRGNKTPEDADVPAYDPKRHRKKHQKIDANAGTEFLGMLALETKEGPICQIGNKDIAWCVALGLSSPDDMSDEMMSCFMCLSINRLFKHYADCPTQYKGCSMCVQIFSLICAHVTDCLNNNNNMEEPCTISLCTNVKHMMEDNSLSSHMKTLWFHVRKKLARLIGSVDEPDICRTELSVVSNRNSQRLSSVSRPSLPSIPENDPIPTGSASGSRVLSRKRSNLTNVQEQTEQSTAEYSDDSEQSSETDESDRENEPAVIYTRGETDMYMGMAPDPPDSEGSSGSSLGVAEPPTFRQAQSRFASLPHGGGNVGGENYYPSFSNIVMGIKGIGEVVYGDKGMIQVVADFWLRLKDKYTEGGALARHYREEGVILEACKNNLKIQGIRYNCQFQWIKHNPLGNGMMGKCHLASDFDTNFKFCVKEIHISNYEKEEIELWSDLDHPNIVKVYGAIRHAETIYILQEFVEGGNLTEAINTQKELNRRLSQVTALAYFRQLLQVLVYLKSKHILHEDLKADNILLKQDNGAVSIKVTDFGLARRCALNVVKGTKPAGTQTQWSPEKSEGVGYGYPAEVWAVVCVLVHMLSGYPPWIRRFEYSKTLMFLIVKKSPPVEDIPRNIHDEVRDMIERGFTVCQNTRPHASDILNHRAFRLLDETSNGKEVHYSILPNSLRPMEDDPNADLREICRNLEKEKNKQEQVPEPTRPYTVYTVYAQEQGDLPPAPEISINNPTPHSNGASQQMEMITSPIGVGGATRVTQNTLSMIDNNTIDQYLADVAPAGPPAHWNTDMIIYNPEYETSDNESETNKTPTDITIMQELLPDFPGLGIDDFTAVDKAPDDEYDDEKENLFQSFDLEDQIKKLRLNSPDLFLTKTTEGSKSGLTSTPEDKSDGGSLFVDDKYENIDDEDELFKSGPSDERSSAGGHLIKVNLFKSANLSSGPRTLPVMPPSQNPSSTAVSNPHHGLSSTAVSNPHQNPSSTAVSNPHHGLSLAPYLVDRNNHSRLHPPQYAVPEKLSPGIGPTEPKMIKIDLGNADDSHYTRVKQPSMEQRNNPLGGTASGVNDRVLDGGSEARTGVIDVGSAAKTGSSRSRKEEKDDDNQKKKDLHYTSDSSHNTGAKAQALYIDVDRAQRGSALPSTTVAQTAPVLSPPRSQPRAEYKRTESEREPPKSQMHKSQSTASTSQFEQQEAAYKELEDAFSQHSDHSHLLNRTQEDIDDIDDEEPHAEFDLDFENPPESIAGYMTAESPSAWVKVTFVNEVLDLQRTMKFNAKSRDMSWEKVIDEEFSRQIDLYSNWDRVYLRFSDQTAVDLDDCLGEVNVTVYVAEATDELRWWMEKGMIMKF